MTNLCVIFFLFIVLLAFTDCFVIMRTGKHDVTLNGRASFEHFIPTWSNDSTIVLNFTETISAKSKFVDCFGLGETVAKALESWFTVNNDKANALDVRFFLSSRNQRNRVQVLPGRQFGLEWTDFRVERRTVFIVHGFLSHGNETWIRDMEEAFLLWDDVNLVVVDWAARGNTFNYYKAVVNTKTVGGEIARFVKIY